MDKKIAKENRMMKKKHVLDGRNKVVNLTQKPRLLTSTYPIS
jgi:hypothetical protein